MEADSERDSYLCELNSVFDSVGGNVLNFTESSFHLGGIDVSASKLDLVASFGESLGD